MKTIEKLLQEYKIRFRDTDRIKEEGYPFGAGNYDEKGNFDPSIVLSGVSWIRNKYGVVYKKIAGDSWRWATADLKEKPDKWVVEIDKSNPKWREFEKWFNLNTWFDLDTDSDCMFYSYDFHNSTELLSFKDHQYLTLDQWAEFFLPKVDFGIINDTDVFYLKTRQDEYLFTGGSPITKKVKGRTMGTWYKFKDKICDKDSVVELRKATDKEKEHYYILYPELRPIKAGEWVAVWDDKDIESLFICKYKNVRNDPDWDNIVKINIFKSMQEQIDEFLKLKQ